jgi:predicted MFS family arabinose efflux permease
MRLPQTLRVLRNPAFRRLWLAQVVSLIGDWFTLIALSVIVSRASGGSGLAVAGLLLMQFLPTAFIGPFSGVLADRFDRRRLLVASDALRAGLVLLLIPVVRAGSLPPVYVLAFLHFTVATVFEPARQALLPRLVEPHELVPAATLATITWSVTTAVGSVLGGSTLAAVGLTSAFVIDALTFVTSGILIASIALPSARREPVSPETGGPGFLDGLRYLRAHPVTAAVLCVKSLGAGFAITDTFLVLFATRVFPLGEGGAGSLGLLWACFGAGALLGPILLNLANDGTVRRMRRLIVAGSVLITVGMTSLAAAPGLAIAALAVVVRGMGGATNWTYSTIVLQKSVPDRLLGRVFALDLALLTLVAAATSLLWGWLADSWGIRSTVFFVAGLSLLPLAAWASALPWMERSETARPGV